MSEWADRLSDAARRFTRTQEYYDDFMIDAGQILIAMVAVLMRYIGSCTTTGHLSTLFNDYAAMSFAQAVNEYFAAACAESEFKLECRFHMEQTYDKTRDNAFLDRSEKKLLTDIHAKFEKHFTRVVPGAGAAADGKDDWVKWTNHDISLELIREFFGSVFLFYYLRAIKHGTVSDRHRPGARAGFVTIEKIRLCLFRDPQIKIGETGHDQAYYGTVNGRGYYSMLMDEIPSIAPIQAFCMLCHNTEILGLASIAQQFSSSTCSSPSFAMLCGVFTHLPTVLPLLENMSRNLRADLKSGEVDVRFIWQEDIPPDRANQLYTLLTTVEGIFIDGIKIKTIEDFKIEMCTICFSDTTQRRIFNTDRSAGLILGKVCSKLCPNSINTCRSCAYACYKTALAQHRDAQRLAERNGQVLPRGWDRQRPETLRCPSCSTGSFGADIVPFIVAEKGIKLHPVIDQLMRTIIEMKPATQALWGPILGEQHAIKPSLKRILQEFRVDVRGLDSSLYESRWVLLRTKYDNPVLAEFIPKFVVPQKKDIDYRFYWLFEALDRLGTREYDAAKWEAERQADAERRREWLAEQERLEEERRQADAGRRQQRQEDRLAAQRNVGQRQGAEEQLAAQPNRRPRTPSPDPRLPNNGEHYRQGGRLNRRTKKRSHGKNLPKSKPKSKTKPKSKSKSKKSKKYNKTRSNRL